MFCFYDMANDGFVYFNWDDVFKCIMCWVVIFIFVYFIGLVFLIEIVYDCLMVEICWGCIRGCCFC